MVSVEWDMEKAKRIWEEEGEQKGIEKGIKINAEKNVLNLLRLKVDLRIIAEATEMSIDRIKELGRINKLL